VYQKSIISATMKAVVLLSVGGLSTAEAVRLAARANPARRIITALEQMEKDGDAEMEAKQDLYDKFICQFKKESTQKQTCIDKSTADIQKMDSEFKSAKGKSSQLNQEIVDHKKDRADAEHALDASAELREKESAEFASTSADLQNNIAGIGKAVGAIEKGTTGTELLQMPVKSNLLSLLDSYSFDDMDHFDLQLLTNFLQGTSTMEEGSSGEIVGILKTMGEQMAKDLEEATQEENNAVSQFEGLQQAKTQERESAIKAIEEKQVRAGQLDVSAVQAQAQLKSNQVMLEECTGAFKELQSAEKAKTSDHETFSKEWAAEKQGIEEATKVLSSDEAIQAFGKLAPKKEAAAASFLQVSTHKKLGARASAVLKKAAQKNKDSRLGFLALALKGKKSGFDKINQMIDNMVHILKEEQKQDEVTNKDCIANIQENEHTEAGLKDDIKSLTSKMDNHNNKVESLKGKVGEKNQYITDLDATVADTTEARKADNALFLQGIREQQNALGFLKQAQGIIEKKLKGKGANVLLLFQKLASEIEAEIEGLKTEEKHDTDEYETFMAESEEERKSSTSLVVKLQEEKAEVETVLQNVKNSHREQNTALVSTQNTLTDYHESCDFIVENFDERRTARENESEALKRAKAVLAGADYE